MAILESINFNFSYPLRNEPALKNINLAVEAGEFVVICGKSGCGKSTLLRQFKRVLAPHGQKSGQLFFKGMPLEKVADRLEAQAIGYVLQSPENQIVTDKVWHELAFGLESLGYDKAIIRLRVGEMASFFGIEDWFRKNVTELSGGQKQLLNLASVMAMQPEILILDEPTSQLDPIAASDFLATVAKINRELGTTVIMSEHRLEEVMPMADRVVVMDNAEIIVCDIPRKVGWQLFSAKHDMFSAMPAPMQIYGGVEGDGAYPITVREGRWWLTNRYGIAEAVKPTSVLQQSSQNEAAVVFKDVWFKYEKNEPDVIKDLNIAIPKDCLYAIAGGNGTGKSTTLSLISGINKPYRGKISVLGKDISKFKNNELACGIMGLLPQNPQALFVKKTVELDLLEVLEKSKLSQAEKLLKVKAMAELVEISELLSYHPYDLSGGEQERAALAKVMLLEPQILLLDEPTKGLDSHFKAKFATILQKLLAKGVTVIMVSHDIEFCAKYANYCALFFDGSVISHGEPKSFFAGNSFYTTAANRMCRGVFPNAVTIEDVIEECRKKN
ncbi:MAG: ATP-binding cassette domain-containing protein [Clostridia bacterium]|nr:ATP-binding cassette domain-containing protein [Clostridia bacterium]